MVKPLSFKGDKKVKKRKRTDADASAAAESSASAVVKADEEVDNDDTWVSADVPSDLAGPVMIVLPTETPSALACDPNGTVFASPVENIVDGNPATAEPSDVRQVWVVSRVAGTEQFRFKNTYGKSLSCDEIGRLSAKQEAVGPPECFTVLPTPDTPGTLQIQTWREGFLSAKETTTAKGKAAVEIRGDGEAVAFSTTLRVRMQARYKPRIRASRAEKALAKISRRELEDAAGRRLEEDEVRTLKKARREGTYHEAMLNIRSKSKHDKFG
ncbi:FRG1-like family-domain-containing protein [Stachybotrys elegans]|uniref:FRG1-like family-domain-containing protein n=1 Tax=Stachybotrys elegans TaxID=80388 RepID=A0A8K0WQA7_9HYPO|nr:FRG1-like family-domain-containing protein [Stachybotrys elegans]